LQAPKKILATVACFVALATSSVDAAYTQLTVFGDSLADAGNVFLFSGGLFPPSPPYAQDLSNGPVAVQVLAANLGLPLTPSLAGGRDYAFGGAETGMGNYFAILPGVPPEINALFSGPPNFPATGVLAQIQAFQAGGGTIAPTELTVLWAGPNDIFRALQLGQDLSSTVVTAVNNLAFETMLLYASGARTILLPNMANLGHIPFGLGSPDPAGLTTLSAGFNAALAQAIPALEGLLPGLNIIGFDTFSFVDAAIANPGAFGFTNVTDPCFNGVTVCANPDQYVFWDLVHPTARSHELLGNAFAAAVVPEPATLALCAIALAAIGFARRRAVRGRSQRRPRGL